MYRGNFPPNPYGSGVPGSRRPPPKPFPSPRGQAPHCSPHGGRPPPPFFGSPQMFFPGQRQGFVPPAMANPQPRFRPGFRDGPPRSGFGRGAWGRGRGDRGQGGSGQKFQENSQGSRSGPRLQEREVNFNPQQYYKHSMAVDPWQGLEPIVMNIPEAQRHIKGKSRRYFTC
ncbi:uncharacterized protein LOC144902501 [Branchiostoma floridae x Branchiostoma belcheri]